MPAPEIVLADLRGGPGPGVVARRATTRVQRRDADDFFLPLHIEHAEDRVPAAAPYLALPSGYRFLIAPGHEDVSFDATILEDEVVGPT